MRKIDQYLTTIDTIYPDGYQREALFRDSGDMLESALAPQRATGFFARALQSVQMWQMKRNGRLTLRDLDESQLRDIGITREEAVLEARKSYFPFR